MGKPLSDEHKKAIAEALRKKYGTKAETPKSIGGIMRGEYDRSLQNMENTKKEFSNLKNDYAEVSKKYPSADEVNQKYPITKEMSKEDKAKAREARKAEKASNREKIKAERAALKEKMLAAIERVKQEKEYQKKLEQQAKAQQKIKEAEVKISKAQDNIKKIEGLKQKANELLSRAKKPEQVQAIIDRLARMDENIEKQNTNIESYRNLINNGGVKEKGDVFDFSETHCFSEKKSFNPWRKLTLQEERVNFEYLQEQYDELEKELEAELDTIIDEDLEVTIKRMEGRIKAGDLAAIAALSFLSFNKISEIIKRLSKKSFEIGKKTSAEEMDINTPITPTKNVQVMNFEGNEYANNFVHEIDADAKQKAKEGILKDIPAAAIVAAVSKTVREKAKAIAKRLVGTVIGESINQGRRLVFDKNIGNIQALQRSEILDSRTCNICRSIDKRIVTLDDPMSKLNKIHGGCRGLWIPIIKNEAVDGTIGIPKQVVKAFDLIGGTPIINGFKQLKKPVT